MMKEDFNLHVCSEDKFIPPFIDFVQESFPGSVNLYYINSLNGGFLYKPSGKYGSEKRKLRNVANAVSVVRSLYSSKRVVLHGFTNKNIILFLAINPWLLEKCYWSIWGSELYFFQKKKNLSERFYEIFRSTVIKEVGHILTYIPGDVELARSWYGAKGKHVECLMYTSNIITEKLPQFNIDRNPCSPTILVGNSADPSNRHHYVFEKLKSIKNVDYRIISPLSYGDKQNADEIQSLGKKMFGQSFLPLMEFMSYEEYANILNEVDVAIFAHERQQAMGNIITLLASGKKIYMTRASTLSRLLRDIGVTIFDITELNLEPIGEKERQENIRIVKEYFSRDVLKKQLRAICE